MLISDNDIPKFLVTFAVLKRKIIALWLIFIILFSGIGFHMDIQYCCNEIVSISLFHHSESVSACCKEVNPSQKKCNLSSSTERNCMSSDEIIKEPHFQEFSFENIDIIPKTAFYYLTIIKINVFENLKLKSNVNNWVEIPPGIPDYHPTLFSCFLC